MKNFKKRRILLLKCPVPNQKSEGSCSCFWGVSILPISTIFQLNLGAGATEIFFPFYYSIVFNFFLLKVNI